MSVLSICESSRSKSSLLSHRNKHHNQDLFTSDSLSAGFQTSGSLTEVWFIEVTVPLSPRPRCEPRWNYSVENPQQQHHKVLTVFSRLLWFWRVLASLASVSILQGDYAEVWTLLIRYVALYSESLNVKSQNVPKNQTKLQFSSSF